MEVALLEIRGIPNLERITICYHPENALAQAFYASFGFKEIGLDDDGEMIAAIQIA